MYSQKKNWMGLSVLLIGLLLSGCGASPEEPTVTPTRMAPSFIVSTPIRTSTPISTPTSTPSPTPTPDPDANAMLAWEDLHLPQSYQAFPPSAMGVQEGASAFSTNIKEYFIASSFAFIDVQRQEAVFGYAVVLPAQSDIDTVDTLLSDYMSLSEPEFQGGGRILMDNSVISGTSNIGDKSSGFRAEYMAQGNHIVLEKVGFRIDGIYAIAFVKNYLGTNPLISASDVARVYASSIQYPDSYCRISQISQVEGATWPAYEYRAEGFYPGEAGHIDLKGEVQIGGETQSVVTQLLGFDGTEDRLADSQGRIEGIITFLYIEGEDVTLPDEFLLSIRGVFSKCEVSQMVPWVDQ